MALDVAIKEGQQVSDGLDGLPLLALWLDTEVLIEPPYDCHPEIVAVHPQILDEAVLGLNAAGRRVRPVSKERKHICTGRIVHGCLTA
jgi:hypothetical protein